MTITPHDLSLITGGVLLGIVIALVYFHLRLRKFRKAVDAVECIASDISALTSRKPVGVGTIKRKGSK